MVLRKVIATNLEAARITAEEVLGTLQANGVANATLFAIRLAMEEALINAIKHGNRLDPHRRIRLSADIDERRVRITVADEGAGFDPAAVPDPTADENLEKPCGRGIMLMRAYMDEVEYNARGNEVRMVKRRPGPPREGA